MLKLVEGYTISKLEHTAARTGQFFHCRAAAKSLSNIMAQRPNICSFGATYLYRRVKAVEVQQLQFRYCDDAGRAIYYLALARQLI